MAEVIKYGFGQLVLHPANDGASQWVHVVAHDGDKKEQRGDAIVEYRWKDLEKALGPEDSAALARILDKIGEAAKAKAQATRPELKTAVKSA